MIKVLLGVAIVLGLFGGWQTWRLKSVQGDLVTALDRLAGYQVLAEFWRGQAARDVVAADLDRDLQEGVGANESLGGYLSDAAGRLWGANGPR